MTVPTSHGLLAAVDLEGDLIVPAAEALRLPVVVLILVAVLALVVELGGFAVELSRRRRRGFRALERAATSAGAALRGPGGEGRAEADLLAVASSRAMGEALATIVAQARQADAAERLAKVLADFDFRSLRRLERTRLLVRFGPALGLMGTLIPLSPALAGLARGDLAQLSSDLRVAFGVTVLGVLVGAVAFAISLVRDRLYGQDLSDLEFVASALQPAEADASPPIATGIGPAVLHDAGPPRRDSA